MKTGQFGACTRAQEVVREGKRQQHCLQYREGLLKFGVISDAACNAVASQLLLSREKFLVGRKKKFLLHCRASETPASTKQTVAWGKGRQAQLEK